MMGTHTILLCHLRGVMTGVRRRATAVRVGRLMLLLGLASAVTFLRLNALETAHVLSVRGLFALQSSLGSIIRRQKMMAFFAVAFLSSGLKF